MKEPFSGIAAALDQVTSIAERLPDDVVRSSARELKQAFAQRGSVEPAVGRLQRSVSRLSQSAGPGSARQEKIVSQLDAVIADQLLPELRRVGFDV
jgi:hypothetical protein